MFLLSLIFAHLGLLNHLEGFTLMLIVTHFSSLINIYLFDLVGA